MLKLPKITLRHALSLPICSPTRIKPGLASNSNPLHLRVTILRETPSTRFYSPVRPIQSQIQSPVQQRINTTAGSRVALAARRSFRRSPPPVARRHSPLGVLTDILLLACVWSADYMLVEFQTICRVKARSYMHFSCLNG
jgi:hypothetical protein